jgi:hypothetical protein
LVKTLIICAPQKIDAFLSALTTLTSFLNESVKKPVKEGAIFLSKIGTISSPYLFHDLPTSKPYPTLPYTPTHQQTHTLTHSHALETDLQKE